MTSSVAHRRFRIVSAVILAASSSALLLAQDTRYAPKGQQIPPPDCASISGLWLSSSKICGAGDYSDWLKDITHWRFERKIRIGYNGSRYDIPALKWTQSSFIQPQTMVQDRYLYDPVAGRYTVDRYLDDLQNRYGGIDSVLIWPTYPNMGIDNRNQHDMIRCMPGGLAGVREMVAAFHRRGVRVLFPMMMWDQGTRDPGQSWPEAIAEIMKELDVDGINGDTQDGVPLAFSLAADAAGHPLAFEPEGSPSDEALGWNVLTWGQYQFPFAPEVDRFKWLEPRHMVNISDRWNRDKTNDLQFAFFNGVGWESWENIWGIWNGITPRDGEATRRIATIERSMASFLISKDWQPLYPMQRFGVFASRWPVGGETMWTIVNRNEYDVDGPQLSVPLEEETRFLDLYHGVEIKPERKTSEASLSFPIEAHGFGAILALRGEPTVAIQKLMAEMKTMSARPLSSYSHEWRPVSQQLVAIDSKTSSSQAPDGMIKIPGGNYVFQVHGIEIEGFNDGGVDVQYPWEGLPRRFHEHRMEIKPFYLDKYPVTNAQFKRFLDAAKYHATDDLNFLRDWENGSYREGWSEKPVTWVSLEDARAYASWAGKRLPHEWEWQFAAEGPDHRTYPWGETWEPKAVPIPDRSRTLRGPDNVDAHPAGVSPFGILDMAGNVWQWTDEYLDEHTRAGILRGGSYYQPQGSMWYFPQAYRNDQHGKLLLMAPSYDRAGTVGFRCARDVE
jgi:iron(II)-dependent oxidoreductase